MVFWLPMSIRTKILTLVFFQLASTFGWTQRDQRSIHGIVDSVGRRISEPPDWLSAGLMELGQGGQLQASARVVRLAIGEPGKWQLPLSVFSGVTQMGSASLNSAGSGNRFNESITWQLYSPWSGVLNFGFEGQRLWSRWGTQSTLRFVFQFGERMLTGYRVGPASDPFTGKQQSLWNHYAVAGWVLQTGAWERANPKNIGRGWVMTRLHLSYSDPAQLQGFFPIAKLRGLYGGASLGVGIEVSRVVQIRCAIYWPLRGPEWATTRNLTQFSFQYNWKP